MGATLSALDCTVTQPEKHPSFQTVVDKENECNEYILESNIPLESSMLWKLQRSFYETKSIVPSFVTTNAFIANAYAKVILSFLREWSLSLEKTVNEPMYIIEIGAGHGKLGFLILQKLIEFEDHTSNDDHTNTTTYRKNVPFVYVLTDFSEKILNVWMKKKQLQKFIEKGILDFAIFDAESNDENIHLHYSQRQINSTSLNSPLFVVCNYVFDTLCQSAYQIRNHSLYKTHCTLTSTQNEEKLADTDILKRLDCSWSHILLEKDTTNSTVYNEKCCFDSNNFDINKLLTLYTNSLSNGSILVPLGAFQLIQKLEKISKKRLIILAGDKGFNTESEFVTIRDPHMAIHGSFSFMVNFDAIQKYTKSQGGFTLQSPYKDGFKCNCFVFGMNQNSIPQTVWAFNEGMKYMFVIHHEFLICFFLELVISILRLACSDSNVFYKFRKVLINKSLYSQLTLGTQNDIINDLQNIEKSYYPLQKSKDICFSIGRVLMALHQYKMALVAFETSNSFCGFHHVTWHNMGICYHYEKQNKKALEYFEKAVEIKCDYKDAIDWMTQIKHELNSSKE
eukprot:GSMAST32.ASY1.ANO1.2313.1 assembled CDS